MGKRLNRISMYLSIILILTFGVIVFLSKQQAASESARLMALREEARVCEREISEINAEVEAARDKSESLCDTATVVVGYTVSSYEDLQAHSDGLLVIDCHADYNLLLSAALTGREILLTCDPFDATYVSYGKGVTGATAFLLQEEQPAAEEEDAQPEEITLGYYAQTPAYESPDAGQIIASLGFTTCIRVGSGAEAATVTDAMLDIPCVRLNAGGADLAGKLSETVTSRDFAVVIFDGTLPSADAADYMTALQTLKDGGSLVFGKISDVEYCIQNAQRISRERQEAFSAYASKQQERIDDLNDQIEAIYSGKK